MRKLLLLVIWASPLISFAWGADLAVLSGRPPAAAAGTAFSDDFNRADGDSLGSNWTETGDVDILSNQMIFRTGAFGACYAMYTGTSVTSATQYIKITAAAFGSGSTYLGTIFRFTDSSSPFYEIQFGNTENAVFWYRASAINGTYTSVNSGSGTAMTVDPADIFGVTIDGTGTAVTVRIWRNPTGLPTAADNWNGDTTPDLTMTDDPASPVNNGSGSFVGLSGSQSSPGSVIADDFFGGSL